MRRKYWVSLVALCVLGGIAAAGWLYFWPAAQQEWSTYTDHTEYHEPKDPLAGLLEDDRVENVRTSFDANRVHSVPRGEWQVNLSNAALALDVPLVKGDSDPHLLVLHPSYAAAANTARSIGGVRLLPSVNMIDGKAKQFDDGLYAATDLAIYAGSVGDSPGFVRIVKALLEKVGPDSPAAPFLAAALKVSGRDANAKDGAAFEHWTAEFERDVVRSKPIGVYTWSYELKECFRTLRFLSWEFGTDDLAIPAAIAAALASDQKLAKDNSQAVGYYARLTNPFACLAISDLASLPNPSVADVERLARDKGVRETVSFLPRSTSREVELFNRLFPEGLGADDNLMRSLVKAIRSGAVNLAPRANSGWYDFQVHALETLLLPERAAEHERLVMTAAYKRRMLDAFAALIVKRRETHLRQHSEAKSDAKADDRPRFTGNFPPVLRVEPACTYYLRTARSYAFLRDFLIASIGEGALRKLQGLRETGMRENNLADELATMQDLFYGLYLIAAEDIGLKPDFLPDEPVAPERAYVVAREWLAGAWDDPDLAIDTRVSVPIFVDYAAGRTRLWSTIGVRLTKMRCQFVTPPAVRFIGADEWQVLDESQLGDVEYLIPVDEFAEVDLPSLRTFDRSEWRSLCDAGETKKNILAHAIEAATEE